MNDVHDVIVERGNYLQKTDFMRRRRRTREGTCSRYNNERHGLWIERGAVLWIFAVKNQKKFVAMEHAENLLVGINVANDYSLSLCGTLFCEVMHIMYQNEGVYKLFLQYWHM